MDRLKNYLTADCNNETLNIFYTGIHYIDYDTREEMINRYFDGYPRPDPLSKSRDSVGYLMGEGDCKSHHIEFYFDETKYTHGEVSVSRQRQPVDPKSILLIGRYSIQLFKGIDLLCNEPDTFLFWKAKDEDGNNTLVMTAVKGGQDVYHADLTSQFP